MRPSTHGLVPEWVATTSLNQSSGLDPAAAVEARENGTTVWFLPGARNVCIEWLNDDNPARLPTVGAVCGSITSANAGNMLAGHADRARRTVTVAGLAPNTNMTVTVTFTNGSARTVPVINNIYILTMPTGPAVCRSVTLQDASGKKRTYKAPCAGAVAAQASHAHSLP
jgi:hypothetical protein